MVKISHPTVCSRHVHPPLLLVCWPVVNVYHDSQPSVFFYNALASS